MYLIDKTREKSTRTISAINMESNDLIKNSVIKRRNKQGRHVCQPNKKECPAPHSTHVRRIKFPRHPASSWEFSLSRWERGNFINV